MKKGDGVFISRILANELPTDRPYSKIEAAYYIALEDPEISIRGLARTFGWSFDKVRLFLEKQNRTPKRTETVRVNPPPGPIKEEQPYANRTPNRTPRFKPPEWIPSEPWYAYMEVRRQIKCANTTRAMMLLVNKLKEFKSQGHNIGRILETATERSWKSVYAPGTYGTQEQARPDPPKVTHHLLPKGKTCKDCGFFTRCKVKEGQTVCTTGIGESKYYER